MQAFRDAIRVIFADENMTVPAAWRPKGTAAWVELRAFRRSPDALSRFGESNLVSDQTVMDVMVEAAPTIAKGDTIVADGEWFLVQSEPIRERQRLVWTLDLRAIPAESLAFVGTIRPDTIISGDTMIAP